MTTTTRVRIDPELMQLIPPLSADEQASLRDSILAEGVRDALVAWDDGVGDPILVDGHNRYRICEEHGLSYCVELREFHDKSAAKTWAIRNQLGRRNITLAARCELALRLEEELRPVAAESKSAAGKAYGRGQAGGKVSPILAEPIDARAMASKEAGVGHGSLSAYKYVKENAEPEEVQRVLTDPTVKLHRVAKDVKQRTAKAKRREERLAAANGAEIDSRIVVGDFREHAHLVADGSIALIFTDPPYDRSASKMLPDLAKFAAAKLANGGSLICYVGQTQIPDAMDAFRSCLRYWWTIACVHAGRSTVMREYGVNAGWKAVLWFVKGTRDDNEVMVSDVMSGGEEKSHHDWQQSESEAAYWIEKLCPQDGLVCDPFLGGGTTGAAAKTLGREWIGFEIDKDQAAIASARVAK